MAAAASPSPPTSSAAGSPSTSLPTAPPPRSSPAAPPRACLPLQRGGGRGRGRPPGTAARPQGSAPPPPLHRPREAGGVGTRLDHDQPPHLTLHHGGRPPPVPLAGYREAPDHRLGVEGGPARLRPLPLACRRGES